MTDDGGRVRRSHRRRHRWSQIERDLRRQGGTLIAGVDEVGRGSLAGPVVACAVIMPPDERAIGGVDDSKQLTAAQRSVLSVRIREHALSIGLGAASVREIERINIYHATVLAMRRALGRLTLPPDHVLVDGKQIRTLPVTHTAVVGGDGRCFSIACASIIAKVTRDRLMHSLGKRHPGYLWERNSGYGTPAHWSALESQGSCRHHRHFFISSRQLTLDFGSSGIICEEAADAMLEDISDHVTVDDLPHEPQTSHFAVRISQLDNPGSPPDVRSSQFAVPTA